MAMVPTPHPPRRSRAVASFVVVLALVFAGCGSASSGASAPPPSVSPGASAGSSGGGGSSGGSDGGPSPSANPSDGPAAGEVTSDRVAAYRVGIENPLLAGVRERQADAVGQPAWWEGKETADGWQLVYTIGWGDCLAGCIERHTFTYDVARDGMVVLVDEGGDAIPAAVRETLALDAAVPFVSQGVAGRATAGPVCPVERPNDPACAPRPVAGAVLVIRAADGSEIARFATGADGEFGQELPVGEYVLEAQPVEGLMGTPAPIPFRVADGRAAELDVSYDTGIR